MRNDEHTPPVNPFPATCRTVLPNSETVTSTFCFKKVNVKCNFRTTVVLTFDYTEKGKIYHLNYQFLEKLSSMGIISIVSSCYVKCESTVSYR